MKNPSDSVIELVDSLISSAVQRKSSDIHLEAKEHCLRVRYRIDGVLYDQPSLETPIMGQIISRVKILAQLNIAERRVPQDGKFCMKVHMRTVDLRVSTFPTTYGEKVVIRILDRSHNKLDLDQIGFPLPMLAIFHSFITKPSGFLLVTGPTGSGKTTTLYAALAELSCPDKNIVTLEDPVEYDIDGIAQAQVYPEAGFTFEKGIRALLRQDPDVVMVGEIRDKQTARIAIEAALTGHMVLSTLHTNDAPGAIVRLMDMGIEPFLINAAVTGVLAQRLARKICQSCRIETKPTLQERMLLDTLGLPLDSVIKGKGCAECFQLGYKGRIGVFELLSMTNELRARIVQQPVVEDLYQQALTDGMKPLIEDGRNKVKEGLISVHELARLAL